MMLAEEILTFDHDDLVMFMRGSCDRRTTADAVVELIEELKLHRGIGVKRPPQTPGPLQVRILPGGE